MQLAPTGKCLFVLNLSAECSLNNGFRYIKELLLQHSNFYMNKCWKLLQENGVDVYTVQTDAFTIPNARLEDAAELLNWDTGIGSWRKKEAMTLNTQTPTTCPPLRQTT